MNEIKTWQQGKFIDQPQYARWSEEQKNKAQENEKHLVRPAPLENAICHCFNPSDAKWIASRLNLASKLEQMTYDFATGKTDGEGLVRFVRESIDA